MSHSWLLLKWASFFRLLGSDENWLTPKSQTTKTKFNQVKMVEILETIYNCKPVIWFCLQTTTFTCNKSKMQYPNAHFSLNFLTIVKYNSTFWRSSKMRFPITNRSQSYKENLVLKKCKLVWNSLTMFCSNLDYYCTVLQSQLK